MSSFGERPLSIRTSRGLTSIAPAPPTPVHPPQPQPGLWAVHSQQTQHTATPQLTNAAELDRTPSPFVKKEPKGTRTYTAFPIVDEDDDKYGPAQSMPKQSRAKTTTAYDPAAPALRRSTRHRSDRILSSRNGEMFEPPTVCFMPEYRNKQLVHILKCHGTVETSKSRACGPNCQTTTQDDKTLRTSWPIDCTHPVCANAREKRHAAVFMPKKRQRTATPAPFAASSAHASDTKEAAVRRSARFREHDEMTAKLNARAANDDGDRIMLERAEGPGVRRKSKRHFGYAFMQEIQEDARAERVFKATGGLDLDFDLDETPMMKRERKNLHTDAKQKFTGMAAAFGLKRKAEDEAAEFEEHDKGFGASRDQERPWSYAPSRNGKKAIRNQEAPNFSMPSITYEAMLREENGVVIEREDTRAHRLPRNLEDVEEEEDAYRGVIDDSVCQACGDEGERTPEECIHCHNRFHRACVGKQDYDVEVDGTCYLYEGPWSCNGFGCNKELKSVRVVCRHLECLHFDYCRECAAKKDETHRGEVVAEGGDPKGHYFVEVEGPLSPALKALEDDEEGGFICAQCIEDRRAKAQALADAKFGGKKTHTIAELQAEVRRLKKLQKQRVQEIAAAEVNGTGNGTPRPLPKLKLTVSTRKRRSSRTTQDGNADIDML